MGKSVNLLETSPAGSEGQMSERVVPEPVPDVTEVTGVYVDSDGVVHLQYRGGDKLYVIRFPLDQILRAEDWFIKIRRGTSGLNSPILATEIAGVHAHASTSPRLRGAFFCTIFAH
jgi:hypothetical protein